MVDKDPIKLSRRWFIQAKKDPIDNDYSFKADRDMLGSGTYGAVFKATHKVTKDPRAIKAIAKAKVKNPESFKNEIEIMKKLDHPNIIKLYEIYEDARYIYLVMELCTGGELFDRISNKGHFSENEAIEIFSQIMHALYYCHSFNICHRDLKPENFLYLTEAEDSH